ncbi:peptidase M23 [Flavobacterium sp. M31R6]|uniref:peptidase M23 n=1 Tax=Flavobacterium sp. M31R6 TaxID=2739062 RepID=UPI001567F2E4|nr:peptidase M23 [Flavobacterium sp. M31R6]QKJ63632.1 peptidase M23 [Flavobacterium sp. M31R6]
MKKSILTLAIATFMIGSIVTSCKPNTEKEQAAQDSVDSAKVAVTDAENDLDEAKRVATAEEWQAFKDSTNVKIEENNAKIAELKLKIKKTGKDIDKAYQRNIDTIEQKNKNLKAKMDSYKNDVNSDWQSFKREFNHDMDELGQSLKDFTVNNKN